MQKIFAFMVFASEHHVELRKHGCQLVLTPPFLRNYDFLNELLRYQFLFIIRSQIQLFKYLLLSISNPFFYDSMVQNLKKL